MTNICMVQNSVCASILILHKHCLKFAISQLATSINLTSQKKINMANDGAYLNYFR